jgi:hypothetical protein
MAEHSKEPWRVERSVEQLSDVITDAAALNVCRWIRVPGVANSHDADAGRICACVNALAGLNPEHVGGLVEAAKTVLGRYMDEDWCFACEGVGHDNDCEIQVLARALAKVQETAGPRT